MRSAVVPVVCSVRISFGDRTETLRLAQQPAEHGHDSARAVQTRLSQQAGPIFGCPVVVGDFIDEEGAHLHVDLGRSLAAQGIGTGAKLAATAKRGLPPSQPRPTPAIDTPEPSADLPCRRARSGPAPGTKYKRKLEAQPALWEFGVDTNTRL